MTRKDFDQLIEDATVRGEELKSQRRGTRKSTGPRKPGVTSVVQADVTAHPDSTMEEVVKRCAIVMGAPESMVLADGFVEMLQTCVRLPRVAKRLLKETANQ